MVVPPSIAAPTSTAFENGSGRMQQLPVSVVAEPVGNSGQIVANRPQHARSLGPRLKMRRQQLVPGSQMLKQLAEPGLRSAADLDQPRMAIDALVEERL